MDEVSIKVGEFQDVFSEFSSEVNNAQMSLSDINTAADFGVSDADLKRELDELLEMDVADVAVGTPSQVASTALPQSSASAPAPIGAGMLPISSTSNEPNDVKKIYEESGLFA